MNHSSATKYTLILRSPLKFEVINNYQTLQIECIRYRLQKITLIKICLDFLRVNVKYFAALEK